MTGDLPNKMLPMPCSLYKKHKKSLIVRTGKKFKKKKTKLTCDKMKKKKAIEIARSLVLIDVEGLNEKQNLPEKNNLPGNSTNTAIELMDSEPDDREYDDSDDSDYKPLDDEIDDEIDVDRIKTKNPQINPLNGNVTNELYSKGSQIFYLDGKFLNKNSSQYTSLATRSLKPAPTYSFHQKPTILLSQNNVFKSGQKVILPMVTKSQQQTGGPSKIIGVVKNTLQNFVVSKNATGTLQNLSRFVANTVKMPSTATNMINKPVPGSSQGLKLLSSVMSQRPVLISPKSATVTTTSTFQPETNSGKHFLAMVNSQPKILHLIDKNKLPVQILPKSHSQSFANVPSSPASVAKSNIYRPRSSYQNQKINNVKSSTAVNVGVVHMPLPAASANVSSASSTNQTFMCLGNSLINYQNSPNNSVVSIQLENLPKIAGKTVAESTAKEAVVKETANQNRPVVAANSPMCQLPVATTMSRQAVSTRPASISAPTNLSAFLLPKQPALRPKVASNKRLISPTSSVTISTINISGKMYKVQSPLIAPTFVTLPPPLRAVSTPNPVQCPSTDISRPSLDRQQPVTPPSSIVLHPKAVSEAVNSQKNQPQNRARLTSKTRPVFLGEREKLFIMNSAKRPKWSFIPDSHSMHFLSILGLEICFQELNDDYFGVHRSCPNLKSDAFVQSVLKKYTKVYTKQCSDTARVTQRLSVRNPTSGIQTNDTKANAPGRNADTTVSEDNNRPIVVDLTTECTDKTAFVASEGNCEDGAKGYCRDILQVLKKQMNADSSSAVSTSAESPNRTRDDIIRTSALVQNVYNSTLPMLESLKNPSTTNLTHSSILSNSSASLSGKRTAPPQTSNSKMRKPNNDTVVKVEADSTS